jgi:hypothetical protein
MKLRFFAMAALVVCVVSTVCSIVAHAQEARTTTSTTLSPNGPEAFSNAPLLTPEQHQALYEKLLAQRLAIASMNPPVLPGPAGQTVLSNTRETTIDTGGEEVEKLVNPPDFVIGKNASYPIIGDGASLTSEPAVANSGKNWFVTRNWSRGYSTNAGGVFTGIPDDNGPADAPFFCCDQDAIEDHGRDKILWSELFVDDALLTGVIRIHVRNKNNLVDNCTYDLNGGAGVLYDYPHLGLGNNFIYITANRITNGNAWTGAIVWRFNLDQIAACQNASGSVFVWTGQVGQRVWVPARGTTDTMFLVTIETTSQNRYFWWHENSNSISNKLLTVGTSNFGAATCIGGVGNANWMQNTLSTSAIGFQIRSAVGQDNRIPYLATYYTVNANGAGRPQAYAAGTIVQTTNMTLLNTADIFNSSACFGFPDVTANSRGDLGLSIAFGSSTPRSGGDTGPVQGYVAISDDYSRGSNHSGFFETVFLCASGDRNPTRYGDYLTARVQEPVDIAFIATSYANSGGSANTRVCEFLRGRYNQAYLDRRLK